MIENLLLLIKHIQNIYGSITISQHEVFEYIERFAKINLTLPC